MKFNIFFVLYTGLCATPASCSSLATSEHPGLYQYALEVSVGVKAVVSNCGEVIARHDLARPRILNDRFYAVSGSTGLLEDVYNVEGKKVASDAARVFAITDDAVVVDSELISSGGISLNAIIDFEKLSATHVAWVHNHGILWARSSADDSWYAVDIDSGIELLGPFVGLWEVGVNHAVLRSNDGTWGLYSSQLELLHVYRSSPSYVSGDWWIESGSDGSSVYFNKEHITSFTAEYTVHGITASGLVLRSKSDERMPQLYDSSSGEFTSPVYDFVAIVAEGRYIVCAGKGGTEILNSDGDLVAKKKDFIANSVSSGSKAFTMTARRFIGANDVYMYCDDDFLKIE